MFIDPSNLIFDSQRAKAPYGQMVRGKTRIPKLWLNYPDGLRTFRTQHAHPANHQSYIPDRPQIQLIRVVSDNFRTLSSLIAKLI